MVHAIRFPAVEGGRLGHTPVPITGTLVTMSPPYHCDMVSSPAWVCSVLVTVWLVGVTCDTTDPFFIEPVVEFSLILLEPTPRCAAFLFVPVELVRCCIHHC